MMLPARFDLDDGSLDGRYAAEKFLGKSIEEAEEMFRENSLAYAESLMWMRQNGALFYGKALIRYVSSDTARGDIEAASSLLIVVEAWLEICGFDIEAVRVELLVALRRILSEFSFYAPDRNTQRSYRDVPKSARRLIRLISSQGVPNYAFKRTAGRGFDVS